ncbi:MAG: hypothetical protein B6U76_06695 [Desulfurococcales archaeon ex4484_217_2]|nr:MAG: hypothetical protein B6U76_06695 [Desulfurococcales archaeon ex4484_217_2]
MRNTALPECVWRREMLIFRELSGWNIVYGRRKTGKTFMVKTVLRGKAFYVIVTRSLTAIVRDERGKVSYEGIDEAMSKVLEKLGSGGTVVIDEFQRVPPKYWDALATQHPKGNLLLISSSMGFIHKILDSSSPLLGLVLPRRVGIISVSDAIASLASSMPSAEAVKWSLILRDPWIIPFAKNYVGRVEPWTFISRIISQLTDSVRALIGEVFGEEDRMLTRVYDATLRLLARGIWSSLKIANLLYARGLLSSASPSVVTGILEKLHSMGLVSKVKLWMTRGGRIYYKHSSPLLAIVYGLIEKLGLDEGVFVPQKTIENEALTLYSRELQFALGELLTEHYGGVQAYTILPKNMGDVDIVILDSKGKAPIASYEVKLGTCSRRDLADIRRRASAIGSPRSGIICLGGTLEPLKDVLEPHDIVRISLQNILKACRKELLPK